MKALVKFGDQTTVTFLLSGFEHTSPYGRRKFSDALSVLVERIGEVIPVEALSAALQVLPDVGQRGAEPWAQPVKGSPCDAQRVAGGFHADSG
jgi:hypothetical protein